jgi:hypothetical protein
MEVSVVLCVTCIGGSIDFVTPVEAVLLFLEFAIQVKKGQGRPPCPFLIDEDNRVMILRFDQGLQIDSPGAQHLGELRIVVR